MIVGKNDCAIWRVEQALSSSPPPPRPHSRGWLIYAANAEKSALSGGHVALDTFVKVFLAEHTDARVHTALPRSSKATPTAPARSTRDTRTHRFLDVCFLVVRAHAALRTIPTTPSTHFHRRSSLTTPPPPPPPLSLPPDPELSWSAPCNSLGGDSYYFHFSNSVGGREASVQHTPSPPSTSLPPSLPPLDRLRRPLTCTPPQVAGRRKNIYIYLFLRGLRLPTLTSRSYPRLAPSSPRYHPPPPPSEILSVCCTFFFFLNPPASFSFLLPPTTSYRVAVRRGAARSRDRRRKRGWRSESRSARETTRLARESKIAGNVG